jgi:DNA polymerase V
MKTTTPIKKSIYFDFFKVPDVTESLEVQFVSVPVNAGFPSPADDYIEDTIDLPKMLIKNPSSTYILRVNGQSMVDAGIFDKSVIVVDASLEPLNGDIAVCIIDGDFTLKRISKVKDKLYLLPENKDYKPLEVKEGNNFEVWGILTWVLNSPNKKRK